MEKEAKAKGQKGLDRQTVGGPPLHSGPNAPLGEPGAEPLLRGGQTGAIHFRVNKSHTGTGPKRC